jgi:hypothetical protein
LLAVDLQIRYVIHHRTDDLLVEQHTVSDRPLLLLMRESSTYNLRVAFFLTWFMCANQRNCASKVIQRYCAILTHSIGLSYKLYWSRFLDVSHSLNKQHSSAIRDINGNPPMPQPELQSTKIGLQTTHIGTEIYQDFHIPFVNW